MPEAIVNELSDAERLELHELVFAARRSIRYHNHRRRFFDRFDKFVKISSLVTGSGAFAAAVATHHHLAIAFSALVALLSAINLVVGPAQAARLHEELARRFARLEHDIKRSKEVNSDQLNAFVADRLMIESDEPPPLRVLDTICHNELCRALGYEDCEFYKVDPVQSLFANFIDLWPWRMKKKCPRNHS